MNILEKNDVEVHPDLTEDCQWIKSNAGPKEVFIKTSPRKDADKIRRTKEKLKGLDLPSICISSAVFIYDSLCQYYKYLCAKCKKP